jgi:hypothetical protein
MKKLLRCALALLAGCADMNDAMTPSLRAEKDNFDGATIVRQPSVGASSTLGEPRYTLGFDWNSRTPGIVYVTAGALGATAITALAFNADGQVIENLKEASVVTDREFSRYGTFAERRFAMSWEQFLAVVNARSVKMRVSRLNDYGVSSFGPDHFGAIVNTKLKPFAEKVGALRGGK